jgi:hypothetical protein
MIDSVRTCNIRSPLFETFSVHDDSSPFPMVGRCVVGFRSMKESDDQTGPLPFHNSDAAALRFALVPCSC